MKSKRKIHIVFVLALVSVVGLWLSTSTGRDRKRYEIETQVYGVPEYRTDAARAIDAYERLMDRHMDLTERGLLDVAADIQTVAARLDAIDARLTRFDARLARIENHLGIAPTPSVTVVDPNLPRLPAPSPSAPPPSRVP
jgi:hypothetical protein